MVSQPARIWVCATRQGHFDLSVVELVDIDSTSSTCASPATRRSILRAHGTTSGEDRPTTNPKWRRTSRPWVTATASTPRWRSIG
jgi:hypothetical protein